MNRKRIAVIGATGQLGSDLVEVLESSEGFDVIGLSHGRVECTNPQSVRKALMPLEPSAVVNCAGFVRVDDCEDHADEAFRVNAIGALNVARTCAELHALCVYVSTDYVFDGTKEAPYVESDAPNPINVYGTSKLAGEILVRQAAPRWLIVRMSSLFGKTGARGKGGNFVETIIAKAKKGEPLRIVDDIRMSPTYARDAATIMARLLENSVTGLVHAANSGSCTWYEFAKAAVEICGLPAEITPVSSTAYPSRSQRPKNSAIRSARLPCARGSLTPAWREALNAYLVEKGHVA